MDADGPDSESPAFADASADCEGCRYALRGLQSPHRLWIAGGYLYAEDWGAAELLRLPLSGGEPEVVSTGVVPQTFALTAAHLYFAAPDPQDDDFRIVFRVAHDTGERERVVRFADDGEIVLGLSNDTVVLRGTDTARAVTLSTVDANGEKTEVRSWASGSEAPVPGCVEVPEDGTLVWCDREDGIWTAPSLDAEGRHTSTGWLAGELDLTTSGLVVAGAPIGEHRIYLREKGGALRAIAASEEPIGSPRFPVEDGVVWVKGGVRLTDVTGGTRRFADSDGQLSTPAEGLAVSSDHVFFTGHRGSEPWSVYRVPLPR